MSWRRIPLGVLGLLLAVTLLSSCSSSLSPYGGSSLPEPLSGCSASAGTPAVPLTLSHVDGGTIPFVPVCVDGHGPYLFVLDTGAATSIVDTQLADALHLPTASSTPTSAGVGCVGTDRRVAIQSWLVGSVALDGQAVLEADIPGFGLSRSPAGVLGSDVLSRFGAVRIDYRSKLLTVLAPEGSPPTYTSILRATIPLQTPPPLLVHRTPRPVFLTVLKSPAHVLATTTTEFGTHPSSAFLIDTGAGISSVEPSSARALGLPAVGSGVTSANIGCAGSADQVRSGQWSIGAVDLEARSLAKVALAETRQEGVTGAIGSDVLSSYGSVVIDYRTAILWLAAG